MCLRRGNQNYRFNSIELLDSKFSLSGMATSEPTGRVNFADLELDNLQIQVEDLISSMDTVSMQITSLSGYEKSGFALGNLSGHLSVGKKHLHFSDLAIVTERSDLNIPQLWFDFDNYGQFQSFLQRGGSDLPIGRISTGDQ